ncbi:MAG: hypothetical protein QW416_06605 [Candidatus Nitrosocaldaceae archaeon]
MSEGEEFPVKSYEGFEQKVIEGYTIYKSNKRWVALVVVETSYKKELRLYAWELKNDTWKVSLASQNVSFWNWDSIYQKIKELKSKYNL